MLTSSQSSVGRSVGGYATSAASRVSVVASEGCIHTGKVMDTLSVKVSGPNSSACVYTPGEENTFSPSARASSSSVSTRKRAPPSGEVAVKITVVVGIVLVVTLFTVTVTVSGLGVGQPSLFSVRVCVGTATSTGGSSDCPITSTSANPIGLPMPPAT